MLTKWQRENPEKLKQCRREYYYRNKESEMTRIKKRKKEIKKWFKEYKKSLKCNRCPENDPRCLDFHHKNGNEKKDDISKMVHGGLSIKIIIAEIKKCEVLCANCHRKETFK